MTERQQKHHAVVELLYSIMSELAKFVAATLEEGVAVELEEEKKQLQNEIEKLKAERAKTLEYASRNGRIEITGKGGLPVYAHGELSRVNYNVFCHEHKLDLTCDPTLCPIKKVKEAEIRLNGLLVAVLSLQLRTWPALYA